jgi:hypothetical protein
MKKQVLAILYCSRFSCCLCSSRCAEAGRRLWECEPEHSRTPCQPALTDLADFQRELRFLNWIPQIVETADWTESSSNRNETAFPSIGHGPNTI